MLGKRAESEASDPNHKHSHRTTDGGIPLPPSPPSVKFLLGKQKLPHKHKAQPAINLKEELQRKVNWGRDAYDDDDIKSNDDHSKIHAEPTVTQMTNSPHRRKKLGEQRKLTPFPALMPVQVPKSDIQNKRLTNLPIPGNSSVLKEQPLERSRPLLQRQAGVEKDEEEAVNSDDSFTSSEEESEDEEESSEESTDEEEINLNDRPIMAKNLGIHGAKIAKQVMQRMKNQRYPSIFRKQIINLDTVYENRYEVIYEIVGCNSIIKIDLTQLFQDSFEKRARLYYKLKLGKQFLTLWINQTRAITAAVSLASTCNSYHMYFYCLKYYINLYYDP